MSIFSDTSVSKPAGSGTFVALSEKREVSVEEPTVVVEAEPVVEQHGAFGVPAPVTATPEIVQPVTPAVEVRHETPKLFGQGVVTAPEEGTALVPENIKIDTLSEKEKPVSSVTAKTPEKSFLEMTEEEKLKNINERAEKIREMLANAKKEMEDKGLSNSFMFGVIGSAKISFNTLKNDVEHLGRGTSPQFAVKLNSVLSGIPKDIATAEEEFKKTAPEKNKVPDGAISVSSPSIDKKVGGGDIRPKMPISKPENPTLETQPSFVVYGRPGVVPVSPQMQPTFSVMTEKETVVPPNTTPEEKVLEATAPTSTVSVPEKIVPPVAVPLEPTKPLAPAPLPPQIDKAPILETGSDAAPGVARLLKIFKSNVEKVITGGPLAQQVAVAVVLSTSPFPETGMPRLEPKPSAGAVVKKEVTPQTSLSLEERNVFSLLATKNVPAVVSLFNLDDVTYNAVCEKMKSANISPYKMLHDGSFTTFEIATANGNRDVRKEVSDVIASIGNLATKLGIENPIVTEYSNESLEQYLGRIEDLVKKSASRTS